MWTSNHIGHYNLLLWEFAKTSHCMFNTNLQNKQSSAASKLHHLSYPQATIRTWSHFLFVQVCPMCTAKVVNIETSSIW